MSENLQAQYQTDHTIPRVTEYSGRTECSWWVHVGLYRVSQKDSTLTLSYNFRLDYQNSNIMNIMQKHCSIRSSSSEDVTEYVNTLISQLVIINSVSMKTLW